MLGPLTCAQQGGTAQGSGTQCESRFCAPCPADVNGDSSININDLLEVIASWGTVGGGNPADVNDDGIVNIADLLGVISAWGLCF
jgi:hypothetical protein